MEKIYEYIDEVNALKDYFKDYDGVNKDYRFITTFKHLNKVFLNLESKDSKISVRKMKSLFPYLIKFMKDPDDFKSYVLERKYLYTRYNLSYFDVLNLPYDVFTDLFEKMIDIKVKTKEDDDFDISKLKLGT